MKLTIKFQIVLYKLLLKNLKKLTTKKLATRLKQADLVNKPDFDNKPAIFNRRITSKYLEVQKKLNSPITKDYNFLLARIYLFIKQHLIL